MQRLALRTIVDLVADGTTIASGALRTAGSRLSSAICIETSMCFAS